jgi:hypothetical protein
VADHGRGEGEGSSRVGSHRGREKRSVIIAASLVLLADYLIAGVKLAAYTAAFTFLFLSLRRP